MRISRGAVAVAVLGAVIAAPRAARANRLTCFNPPSADQCRDRDWQNGPCFAKWKNTCMPYYVADYEAQSGAAPSEPRMVPSTGVTRLPADSMTLTHYAPVADHVAANGSPGSFMAMMDLVRRGTPSATFADPRPTWAANGNRVDSCAEYVYEKYFDWNVWEDAVAAVNDGQGHDDRTRLAMLLFMMPTGAVFSRSRQFYTIIDTDPDAREPKNPFFTANVYRGNFSTWVFDPTLLPIVTAGANVRPWTFAEELTTGAGFLGAHYDDEFALDDRRKSELVAFLAQRADTFARYNRCYSQPWVQDSICPQGMMTWIPPNPDGSGAYVDIGPSFSSGMATMRDAETALDEQLQAELLDAQARGCLDPTTHKNLCDFSPRLFLKELSGQVHALEEGAFRTCVEMVGNDFDAPQSVINVLKAEAKAYPGTELAGTIKDLDYTSDATMIDVFIRELTELLENEQFMADPVTHRLIPGQGGGQSMTYGGNTFGVTLSYSGSWRLDNFDAASARHPREQPQPSLCDVDGTTTGSVDVFASALGSSPQSIVHAQGLVDVDGTNLTAGVTFSVLGETVYAPSYSGENTFNLGPSDSRTDTFLSASMVVPVLGVPVTVAGGISGTVGYTATLQGGVVRDCDAGRTTLDMGATFAPQASLDGFASASVGIGPFQAGVKGDVTLIGVSLPLDAHVGISPRAIGDGIQSLDVVAQTTLDVDLHELDGRVAVFVDYPLSTSEWTLVSWSGLHQQYRLFERDLDVPVQLLTDLQYFNGTDPGQQP